MAMKNVVALFDDFNTARDAIQELVDNGFNRDQISLLASDASGEYSRYFGDREKMTGTIEDEADSGASVGAGIGAVIGGLGGLLVGLGALAIPGIGPVLAAGPLATAISALAGAGIGAVAGGVTGGLIGALVDMGVPEEQAGYYSEGIRRGGTLVTLQTDDMRYDQAVQILNRFHPVNIKERADYWRQQGWRGFETGESMETERGRVVSSADYDPERAYARNDDYDFDYYADSFRQHYRTSMAGSGYPYGYYEPAYRYGFDLAQRDDFRGRDWDDFEMTARDDWELDHPGTWEEFKATVRHAWEKVKEAVS